MFKRLLGNSGVASLEALLSIVLMLISFYVLWGVSVLIYNQSQVTTAAQFAAQAAMSDIVTIDPYIGTTVHEQATATNSNRPSYGESYDGDPTDDPRFPLCKSNQNPYALYKFAECFANKQAQFIFAANTDSLLPDAFTGTKPSAAASTSNISVLCTANPKPWDTNVASWSNCLSIGNQAATGIAVQFNSPSIFSFADILNWSSPGIGGVGRRRLQQNQTNLATAIRYEAGASTP